jgi:hypothetical protein
MLKPLVKHFGNYSFLLIVLVLMLVLHPLLDRWGQEFVTVAFTLVFLAGLYAVRGERRTLIIGLVLVVPALLTGWAGHAVDSRALFAISRGLEALFLFYVTAVILHQVMTESEMYDFWEFVYFSLVTITTLGYGDIAPVSQEARSLATLQAVTGQFYVAVLVARFVAILSSRPRQPGG